MEQKITPAFQSKWPSKLMGFDYEICYKKGKESVVANGLSRVSTAQLVTMTVSSLSSELLEQVKQTWGVDDSIQTLINKLTNGEIIPKYIYSQGLLYRNDRVVVGNDSALHSKIIQLLDDSSFGGHSGVATATKRVASLF